MSGLDRGSLDKWVRIERPVADDSADGAGSGSWELVDEVWASVRDALPSRGERMSNGAVVATRPARVRMDYRDDVTSEMRLVMGSRIMQIVTPPAELGRFEGLEFMVEEYRPAGNPA
ncbi:head-tail adaptor protein [Sphingomonas sp. C8-2]|nr:head-tail adaptor protein [Sphingomonas sp. C8-2]